jgi:hypothetical protein
MRHFGRGLVSTPANFGRSGALPSHPELLDWLATEFVRGGWRMKAMHRLLMTSNAYRQSSRVSGALMNADPDNILLGRMRIMRMDAEALYDSIIKVTGRLDPRQFGPAEELETTRDKEVLPKGSKSGFRRSIYLMQRRNVPVTLHEGFDLPPMTPNCTERAVSTVPTQALQLMNSSQIVAHTRYMAGRIIDVTGGDQREQIREAYRRALSRAPTDPEVQEGLAALTEFASMWKAQLSAEHEPAPIVSKANWYGLASLCHSLINSAEFSYVD